MAASGPMVRALADACRGVDLPPRYTATRALARRYAALLDDARGQADEAAVYESLGPKLLAALAALGMTAPARTERPRDGVTGSPAIDELRAKRARRSAR